ncbi:MAG TPA: TIR domain-containing protein [Chitinophagaceae bacterium]
MKVFISWSGELSKQVAQILKKWLPVLINSVKPYCSTEDIAKGSRWFTEILNELSDTEIGIICLTNENVNSPWLMFEAGALSVNVEKSKVCPICFNIDPINIKGPLANFQATKFSKEDFKRLILTINKELGKLSIDISIVEKAVEGLWVQIESEINNILKSYPVDLKLESDRNERSEKDLLLELLERTRELPFIQLNAQVQEKQTNQVFENLLLTKIDAIQRDISLSKKVELPRDEIYNQNLINARANKIRSALFEKLIPLLKESNKSYESFLKDSAGLDKLYNVVGKMYSLSYSEYLKYLADFNNNDVVYAVGTK